MSSTSRWNENRNGKDIELPETFKCRICSKIKPATNDHFSKKEFKSLTSRIAMGKTVTTFNANLRCRHCSGENVFELLCQNCQVTKSKDDFSYNQRTTALVARCKACVNWTETNEPGTETLPGPSMALQPDSTLASAPNQNPGNALSVLVNSANQPSGGDDTSSVWRTTNPGNNTMSVPAGTSVRPTTTRASVVETRHPSAPPGFAAPTRILRRGEDVSALGDVFSQLDPFGHRSIKEGTATTDDANAVAASSSVDYGAVVTDATAGDMWITPKNKKTAKAAMAHDAWGPTPESFMPTSTRNANTRSAMDTTSTVNTGTRSAMNAGITFTGYDNQGNAHPQTVAPSAASSTRTAASVTASTAFEDGVASRKYGRPGRTTPRGNSSREWFKAPKPRKEDTNDYRFEEYAPADLAAYAPPTKRPANDDGESDDEI
ncbi:hypothetical protein VE03_09509 [Pseudogymnoascus sp. 23342-1-I1]|nr:hypothetical protein VE03_09509 [Pseudogymnoascus sp. 23342-1-I1]